MKLGERIKELRVINGLSQDELALKMGYRTRSSINKIEKGLNILPLKKLEKMAKILGTSTEYLLNGHQSKNLLDEKSMTLGERIREKRKAKGLTIRDMGEVLNLSYSIVAKYERNEVPITTIMLEKLAKILGTSTEYLLNGDKGGAFMSKEIGVRLANLRKNVGLTQDELANRLNKKYNRKLSKITISKIENGERNLSQKMSKIYSEFFNVSLDWIMGINNNNLLDAYLSKSTSDSININNFSNKRLGDRIKYLRKKKKLSQEKLAQLIGVNIQNVYRYEKGMITDLPISRIEKLAEALDTTVDYLLNSTEIIEPEPYVENLGIEIVPKIETINEVDYVSSRTIAEQLGKRHSDVLESLENIIKNSSTEISVQWFLNSTYKDNSGKANKEYLLTRDGFTLYMFNIQGYNDFKIAYIQKFNEMEQLLLNRTRDDLYKLKFMSFKLDLLYKILSGTSTPKDFDDWKEFIFNNDMNEELLACEVKNRERYNARGNKIKTITLEFETMDDPVLTRIPV